MQTIIKTPEEALQKVYDVLRAARDEMGALEKATTPASLQRRLSFDRIGRRVLALKNIIVSPTATTSEILDRALLSEDFQKLQTISFRPTPQKSGGAE